MYKDATAVERAAFTAMLIVGLLTAWGISWCSVEILEGLQGLWGLVFSE